MGVGIEVYNPDGSLQFDIGSRLFRTLNVTNTSTAGSITISGATAQGTVVAAVVPVTEADGGGPPVVTVSGNTVSWTSGVRSNINIMVY